MVHAILTESCKPDMVFLPSYTRELTLNHSTPSKLKSCFANCCIPFPKFSVLILYQQGPQKEDKTHMYVHPCLLLLSHMLHTFTMLSQDFEPCLLKKPSRPDLYAVLRQYIQGHTPQYAQKKQYLA